MNPRALYRHNLAFWLTIFCLGSAMNLKAENAEPGMQEEQAEVWQLVGQASLTVLWFDVYDARLETLNGRFESVDKPLRLTLDYKRDIDRDDLLKETAKQLKPFTSVQKRQAWIAQLRDIWPNIRKGDQLIFQSLPSKSGFIYNESWIGGVNDSEFASGFAQIWLSDESEYPRLARQLRGE